MTRYAALAVAFLFAVVPASHAQRPARDTTGVVAGRVVDAATSQPRIGAGVQIVGSTRARSQTAPGASSFRRSLWLDHGRARLLGYKTADRVAVVRAGDTTRVDFALEPEAAVLGAVRTEARPIERDAFDSRPSVGTVSITARAAEGVPKFGEPDIIRIVQLLPASKRATISRLG